MTKAKGKKTLPPKRLTLKQQRFVDLFTGECDGNASKAYKMAGYAGSDKTCGTKACDLMKLDYIKKAIKESIPESTKRIIATKFERQELLTKIMLGDVDNIENAPTRKVYDEDGNLVETIKIQIPYKERLKALELLSKMNGDFLDVSIVQNTNVLTVNQNLVSDLTKMSVEELRALRGLDE